ncbi:Beta-TrCP [Dactylella cylindrospora]|nr:Beta-TrCP [Dactylella cylindrospora]
METVRPPEAVNALRAPNLRSRISIRAKASLTIFRKDPPPKRNDTPLNFVEAIPINVSEIGFDNQVDRQKDVGARFIPDLRFELVDKFQSYRSRFSIPGLTKKREGTSPRAWPTSKTPCNAAKTVSQQSGNRAASGKDGKALASGHRGVLGNLITSSFGIKQNNGNHNKSSPGSRVDIMTVFPPELVAHIFSYLDCASLLACELVSHSWHSAATSPQAWKHAFEGAYGKWVGFPYGRDWKSMFEVKLNLNRRWLRGQVTPVYLTGHTDSVYCIQFDRQKIITGSRDRTVRVWDISTGRCVKVIGPANVGEPNPYDIGYHRGSILCLQFDEDILVTGSSDHDCIVYSLPSFKPILKLPGHRMGVLDVCFDGSHIVSCSKDTTICIWDRRTGLLMNRLRGHQGPVNAVQLRGNLLASASGDATVKLWDIETGICIKTFTGHSRGLACIQLSEDGGTIISGGNDQNIRVWDVATGNLRYEIRDAHKSLVRSLYLDSANSRIISGSYDQSVRVWDLRTGKSLLNFPRWHGSWILAAKADETRIVSTGQDSQILMLDFSTGIRRLESII